MNLLSEDLKIGNFRFSFAALLWFLLACIGAFLKIRLGYGSIGNFLVYRDVFWHGIHQMNLYENYPAENLGSYLYGPVFSIIISPFALLPVNAGAFLWAVANAVILFYAVRKLPVNYKNQNIVLIICAIEMMTSIQNMQINCIAAALIILSFTYIKDGKDFWAALLIALGFLIKVYGIVGIVFILFSGHKTRLAFSFLFWLAVLFCLPMIISSPSFIIHSYFDWYHALTLKNEINATSLMQDISVMGILRHLTKTQYLNLLVIPIAGLFYLIPLFRFNQLKNKTFQLTYLCFALIGVVIFSSSAESPTYIIAMVGVALWFVIQNPKNSFVFFLLGFALVITSLSATDFFPHYIKLNFIQPYSLKALPCFIVWAVIAFQLITAKNFNMAKLQV
ncbi:MAG: glycosyltransferase family 87 protein [Ginsengibacter sp.]